MIRSALVRAASGMLVVAIASSMEVELHAAEPATPHGSFKADCSLCHGPDAWKPARISDDFDHHKHGFALTGAHAGLNCRSCHETLDFKLSRTECVECHLDVHSGELGPDCDQCHTTRNFIDRADEVRRHRMTSFPLRGAHLALDCDACHRIGDSTGRLVFVNTPAECISCHLMDSQNANNPDHRALGFSTDCTLCHSEAAWAGSAFRHDETGFPLTGGHAGLACEACHPGGRFVGTQSDCFSCHQKDYEQAANPNHLQLGFSTDCTTCHTTTTWTGATFDHDSSFFPIYSGKHKGKWADCSVCHMNSATFTEFSCVACHKHSDKTKVDAQHANVAGYVYDSQACFSCHPLGLR